MKTLPPGFLAERESAAPAEHLINAASNICLPSSSNKRQDTTALEGNARLASRSCRRQERRCRVSTMACTTSERQNQTWNVRSLVEACTDSSLLWLTSP